MGIDQLSQEPRAVYMRQYLSDPEHPGRRERKRTRDRLAVARDGGTENRRRATQWYCDNTRRMKRRESDRLRDLKIKAVSLLGARCQRCGFNAHPAALQFHHRDPAQKKISLSVKTMAAPRKYPWGTIVEEINKCDLLCANCHAIVESTYDLEAVWPITADR